MQHIRKQISDTTNQWQNFLMLPVTTNNNTRESRDQAYKYMIEVAAREDTLSSTPRMGDYKGC